METDVDAKQERRIRRSQVIRTVAVLALAGLVLAFAAINTHEVAVDYGFDEAEAPMIAIIAIVGLLGLLIGALARRHRD